MNIKQPIYLAALALTGYVCTAYLAPAIIKWVSTDKIDPAVERAKFIDRCAEQLHSHGAPKENARLVNKFCVCITEKIDKEFDWADRLIDASEVPKFSKRAETFAKECYEMP